MTDYIVSDVGSAFALPRVQSKTCPCAQGWQVQLRYLSSRFPASGHATVPWKDFPSKVSPFALKGQLLPTFLHFVEI